MKIENLTSFSADRFAVTDENGADLLLIMLKARYDFNEKGELTVAELQEPIELADQYYKAPENSSVRYASDFSFGKTSTDVALVGHAYAPNGQAKESFIGIRVGNLQKNVKIFGNRCWEKVLGLTTISSPKPFEKIPLIYERAYGGVDKSHDNLAQHEFEPRNPVGLGFRAKKSQLPVDGMKLPNIENPNNLIIKPEDRPEPTGFGFIAPTWLPRTSYAGTYDDAWQKKKMPLLPDDFDKKFFNAAHPDLVYPGFLQGNEPIEIVGVSPNGGTGFSLPAVIPRCNIDIKEIGEYPVKMNLDKVLIDADNSNLIMLWSGNYKIECDLQDVEYIKFQT